MRVLFTRWHPSVPDSVLHFPKFWDVIYDVEKHDVQSTIERLINAGYYVAQHKGKDGTVTIAVDTTWFRQR